MTFARAAARDFGVYVHASLYERADPTADDGLGFNTAVARRPERRGRGPHPQDAHPGHRRLLRGQVLPSRARPTTPTRSTTLAEPGARLGHADLLGRVVPRGRPRSTPSAAPRCSVYPTAIGSEPDHPDFDTQPLWQQVIVGNGIANGLFMVVPNRFGTEGLITFYG